MAENKYINVNLAKAQFTGNFIDNYPPPLIKALLDSIPAADVEPVRRGRWITSEMTIDSGCTSCSCCHSEYYIGDLQALEGDNDFVMYCPNCGAKMNHNDKCTIL